MLSGTQGGSATGTAGMTGGAGGGGGAGYILIFATTRDIGSATISPPPS
jgi:hypothetical protein